MKQLLLTTFIVISTLLCFSCSNSDDSAETIVEASRISGGPFIFCIGDGESNFVNSLEIVTAGSGDDFTWVVTDEFNNILEIPKTIADTEAIDFENSGPGNCKLWLLHYNNTPDNLLKESNLFTDLNEDELKGLSNAIEVIRAAADPDTNTCPTL